MQRVTIEYLDMTEAGHMDVFSATGVLEGYCNDGDVIVSVRGERIKGMPVQFHKEDQAS